LILLWSIFDVAGKQARIAELERQTGAADFWTDAKTAQDVMRELNGLRADIEGWTALSRRAHDALELIELAESDPLLAEGVRDEVEAIRHDFRAREFQLLMPGRHDRGDAILAIHAGAGGIDAADWASMLMRMYLRWAENRGFKSEVLDQLEGEEAGIRNATISVVGEYAYGYLRAEKGVHRLVRLSPFDSAHRRHTSFALVEVWPDLADNGEVAINPNDLKIDTFRASSAGGQHVQKNATAVRITHLPTGIVVSCQNERSQAQNRETAMKIVRARLFEIEEEKQRKALAELKGEHVKAEWGSQIRSYVLHPYQMVKDHRTEYEVGNAQGVLDGQLDGFIESFLRSTVG
jgi:peptide chain release factor 2